MLVANSEAEFLIALSNWEADRTVEASQRLRGSYNDVIDEWEGATRRYFDGTLGLPWPSAEDRE